MRIGTIPAAVAALLLACGPAAVEEHVPEPTEAELARVEAAAEALIAELGGRLLAELGESGAVAAIDVCSQVAQEIARAHSGDGLSVRRVSLEVRNPLDEPDDWDAARLAELESLAARNDLPPRVVGVERVESGHELRYLKPLRIAPPCLTCHGDPATMERAVIDKLEELYPGDTAIGYALGDLRGAVSVRLRLGRGS